MRWILERVLRRGRADPPHRPDRLRHPRAPATRARSPSAPRPSSMSSSVLGRWSTTSSPSVTGWRRPTSSTTSTSGPSRSAGSRSNWSSTGSTTRATGRRRSILRGSPRRRVAARSAPRVGTGPVERSAGPPAVRRSVRDAGRRSAWPSTSASVTTEPAVVSTTTAVLSRCQVRHCAVRTKTVAASGSAHHDQHRRPRSGHREQPDGAHREGRHHDKLHQRAPDDPDDPGACDAQRGQRPAQQGAERVQAAGRGHVPQQPDGARDRAGQRDPERGHEHPRHDRDHHRVAEHPAGEGEHESAAGRVTVAAVPVDERFHLDRDSKTGPISDRCRGQRLLRVLRRRRRCVLLV